MPTVACCNFEVPSAVLEFTVSSAHMAQGQIAKRQFGKTDIQISALGLGGHHLGQAEDLKTAKQIVHRAIDGGVNFFDNCWEYHSRQVGSLARRVSEREAE